MFLSSLLSYFYPSSASQATAPSVALPPLQVRDLERIHDPASRRTRQFLKLIHMSDALVPKKHYSEHQDRISFLSHLVISVYLLGANADQITQLCDGFQGVREQWEQAPSEVTKHDWRDFLGNPAYQRGFVDFFEDDISKHGYDWKVVLQKFLYDQETPFIHQLMSGGFEPVHHLAMAYRLQNKQLAVESLTLAAIFYNKDQSTSTIHNEQPASEQTSNPNSTSSISEILERVSRIDPSDSTVSICKDYSDTWDLEISTESPNLNSQFREAQRTATALLVTSVTSGRQERQEKHSLNFSQILVATQSLRTVLPLIPCEYHTQLLRQWLLNTLVEYVAADRPSIDFEAINGYPTKDRDWPWIEKHTLDGKWRTDVFYVQVIATLKDASNDWRSGSGDLDDSAWFLNSALKFVDEFDGWLS